MHFSRLVFLLLTCFALGGRTSSAQDGETNLLTFCSEAELIEAIESGGDYFMDCGTNIVLIRLTEPLVITKRVSIFTTNQVVLTGSNATRLIVIQPTGDLTLGGFSLFSGRQTETNENNGGIEDTAGGAVYNDGGKLRLLGGRVDGNSAIGITGAAAEDGTGENGEHGGDAAGGAIYNNSGSVMVSNVVFAANSTTGGAGGKGGSGRNTGFGMPGGNGGDGGSAAGSAIYSEGGSVFVVACTFTNNTAIGAAAGAGGASGGLLGSPGRPGESGDGVGAAVTGTDANVTIFASTFIRNRVTGANGLNGNAGVGRNQGDPGLTGGEAAGGAIYFAQNQSATNLSVKNSTFFQNSATSGRGGNGGTGSADNFGFDGGEGGNGGLASGGAIDSEASVQIVHCSFADNSVTAGAGGSGGAGGGALGESGDAGSQGPELGATIYGSSTIGTRVILANSVIANSTPSLAGEIDDRGGNITTDNNLEIVSSASFRSTNPFLRALANNGGPTLTMAIRTNSPALDNGVAAFCEAIDQRGSNRVGRCDIGAFEYIPPLSEVLGTNGFQVFGTNDLVFLRWPVGHTNVLLQGTTNLLSTNTVWTAVTNGITATNNLYQFTVSPDSALPYAFYRLFSPETTNSNGGNPFPPFPPFPPLPPIPGAEMVSGASAHLSMSPRNSTIPFTPAVDPSPPPPVTRPPEPH